MRPLKTLFTAIAHWSDVEILYKHPTADDEPRSDNHTDGSSNHTMVFNRRILAILNRIEFVKESIFSTILGEFLRLDRTPNTLIGFDINGLLIPVEAMPSYDIGDCKQVSYNIYTTYHVDNSGYVWHNATAENPINNSMSQYRDIYFLLWGNYQGEGKGDSCIDDWNLGYNIYIDLEGALIFTGKKKVDV